MPRQVVEPIGQIAPRMPTAGKIRLGVRTKVRNPQPGKSDTRPTSIDTFRFTSPDRDAIEKIAELYGGECKVWEEKSANPPNQWQVITPVNRIRVVLPVGGMNQWYELWAGPSRLRQCDGVMVTTTKPGPEGTEQTTEPCICSARRKLECTALTRMQLILPDIPFRGVWLLQTSSEYALREIPGMLDTIHRVAAATELTVAELSIQKHKVVRYDNKGQPVTKHFVVPTLSLPYTPEEIVAGAANLMALKAGGDPDGRIPPERALAAGPVVPVATDDDIEDAEVVGDRIIGPEEQACRELADELLLDPTRFWEAMVNEAENDLVRVMKGVAMIRAGKITPGGIANGRIQWVKS